jgi:enterochelin esterase family protein
MKKLLISLFILFSSIIYAQGHFASFLNQIMPISSSQTRMALTDSFMTYAATRGFPFIDNDTAVFLYRGSSASVSVAGDFNNWNFSPMINLAGTNLFFYQAKFEMDARLDYKFVLPGNNYILDPLNPHKCYGGFGPNSELAMPAYIQPWDISYNPIILHGTVAVLNIFSINVSANYQLSIYLPPGYNSSFKYPTVYFQDGADYINLGSAINVLDNLIDSSKIEKVIGVFVTPNDRNNEYAGTTRNQYRFFFVNELVPFIDSLYSTYKVPEKRLVLGDSYGGNISALISYNHPGVFGNCGLHSPAFQPNNNEAYNLITNGSMKNIRFSAIWGTYMDPYQSLQTFRDILISKGYLYDWKEVHEGHSWGQWRANIKTVLQFIFPKKVAGANDKLINKPGSFVLGQNYPNPFNPNTTIEFTLEKAEQIKLYIYNSLGQIITSLINGFGEAGVHKVLFKAANLPSGIYYYRLILSDKEVTKSMILLK